MRFVWTIGRLTIFDFTLFRIDEETDPDVLVVHHHHEDDEGNNDGPDSIFGKGN